MKTKKIAYLFIISAVLVFCGLFCGCEKNENTKTIELPEEFTFTSDELWAVFTEPYSPFYAEPDSLSDIEAHARRGDVVPLTGRRISPGKELWYHFEKGWVPQNSVTLYTNRLKAQNAAKALLNGE